MFTAVHAQAVKILGTSEGSLATNRGPSSSVRMFSTVRLLVLAVTFVIVRDQRAAVPDVSLDSAFRLVRDAVEKKEVPGAIALVARDGKILRHEALGLRDIENQLPFTTNTLCWIASITKPVTVAAAMTLVDAGKLGLDDPVEKYLPEFREQTDTNGAHHVLTIRQLMSHTSGLVPNPPRRRSGWPMGGPLDDFWLQQNLPEIVRTIARSQLRFKPGSKFEYSNSSLFVLGRVIEVLSGQPYATYVREKILEPLGMSDTHYAPPARQAERVAKIYAQRDGRRETIFQFNPAIRISNPAPDGGLFSYPAQFVPFLQMFLNNDGRVLSRGSVKDMLTEQPHGWGLGWSLQDSVFMHEGSSGTVAWADPKTGVIGILFLQYRDQNKADERLRKEFRAAVQKASADKSQASAGVSSPAAQQPIKLHPENPHYFLWREKPAVLITSGEHYGAALNLDFDYLRYLDELQSHRFNLTRTFSGTYREVPGSFNISGNTLAPGADRFVCPWARSESPGASDGGNKFDLTKWDQAYFARLKDFIKEAASRGIVVELVLFCTMYDDNLWAASPMNARNNINGIGRVERREVYNGRHKDLLAMQRAVVRKLVTELNEFDNLYYEVCNEPYERGGLTREWNDQIAAAIVEAEAPLPQKHLVAQGFPPSSRPITDLNPNVSVLNFHAAKPDAARLNYGLNKVIAFDETGGSDRSDRKYRTEGWEFILGGGGVYDHLDFSFTPDREDGTAPLPAGTPGGGGPELRRQLGVLKDFIESFDFIRMTPNDAIIKGSRITTADARAQTNATVKILAQSGQAFAIYVNGGVHAALQIELPAAGYRAEWINTWTGRIEKSETFTHTGGNRSVVSPAYSEDVALRLKRTKSAAE
jgi:CubicO group peptidase (beta-lactamase class C family)